MQCVLVVDKSSDSVLSLQTLLQNRGYEACVASDGLTALDVADRFWPDVVVLDISLPGRDGYELAKRLQKPNPEKPFIVVQSGFCTESDVRRSLGTGLIAHLPKPVDPEDIRKILGICEKWLRLNSPAQRKDSPRPTASLPAMPTLEA